MNGIQRRIRTNFSGLILAFTAAGFVMLLVELLLERHWDGIQLIAPLSAALGAVLAMLALRGQRTAPLVVLLLVLSVTGLFGTFEHFEERTAPPEEGEGQEQAAQFTPQAQLVSEVGETASESETAAPEAGERGTPPGEEGPRGEGEGGPPWLAPLSLSGLALLGAAATVANKGARPPLNA